MRAIVVPAFGGPDVMELVEVPVPEPAAGQVLVQVRAAGVNAADPKIRAGEVAWLGDPPLPLGLEASGVVVAGDGAFPVGAEVFGAHFSPPGGYAEYWLMPADALASRPAGLDHPHAAALPIAGLTAWQALVEVAGLRAGQRVLVHGAAGGVGHLAAQIALARGASVVGTARAAKHAALRELGLTELVDATATDFATAVRDVDVVLDAVGGDDAVRALDTLAPGGMIVEVAGPARVHDELARAAGPRGLRSARVAVNPAAAGLAPLLDLVERGALRVLVDRILPLAEAAAAHRLLGSGRITGKVVLVP
ncbi:MAG: NADP-dependent oxidoreductase [Mycobacteriales bacterium]